MQKTKQKQNKAKNKNKLFLIKKSSITFQRLQYSYSAIWHDFGWGNRLGLKVILCERLTFVKLKRTYVIEAGNFLYKTSASSHSDVYMV